jgi:nucleotide-binding universal stress UspA family protein
MYADILVPTDGSPGTERIVEHAAALADEHGATLHLLYVVNTASFADLPMESSYEGIASMLEQEGETALADAEATAERVAPDLTVEHAFREGSPSREIVEYATETACDVITMGTHGRGGLNRLLLGSVAERVVRKSPVPVLTVRVGEVPDESAKSVE